ncbi:transglutaminase-like domain-containing protein [Mycoplasma sp. 3686d]|uniref:transglutaminase-like domain-containing protein n=1 Tax=Mycoplasma sp. 3686d TaxID=2967300 RepID=UPI00211D0264|nr:transglutaminase domain-containing protein [Mycoplasma sp. 3686d]UUM24528.1 hypothetical protein NPA12_02400 [Mycoplasma sp. 3686d]
MIWKNKKLQSFLVLTSGLILSTPVIFSTSLVSLNNLKIQKIKNIPINPPKNIISPKPIISVPKPTPALLSNYQKEQLNEWKSEFNNIILDSQNTPLSQKILDYLNSLMNLANNTKISTDFYQLVSKNPDNLLNNYKIFKQEFLNSNKLISSPQDKQEWARIFKNKSNLIKDNPKLTSDDFASTTKDFYIYKLKQQIHLYEKYPYYLQPLERLKKLLYYYQNNYGEYVEFQWGIDKNDKFSLEPNKYYSSNIKNNLINDEYISNWLKYYQRWNWIFVDDKDKIPKIQDKDIQALQIKEEFQNNPVLSEYIKRQINFQPDNYDTVLNINLKHPENVDYKQYKKFDDNFSMLYDSENYKEYEKQKSEIFNEINKLKKTKYIFDYPNVDKKYIKLKDKEYGFYSQSLIKNLDYKKYYLYQKLFDLKSHPEVGALESLNIYNNLLFKQPNLFSDGSYKGINFELINPKHNREQIGDIIVDYSYKLTEEESQKLGVDIWINPISEYKKWFNKWKEVLPNIINKNWDTKTKIKAIAYYIATNSLYLIGLDTSPDYNYNGYGFYNPTQIFTNDPEIKCVGYSMNLAAALTILNIPVRILGGAYFGDPLSTIANAEHAWNEVFVDGRWKAIDLTNWDRADFEIKDNNNATFELRDDIDLFQERNSEWMNHYRLDLSSYETTIMFYQNPKEYEYQDLPDSL